MLKLTYTDNNFCIERLNEPLENWLNLRVILSLRAATSIYVEPSTASFLVYQDLAGWEDLRTLQQDDSQTIEINVSDAEHLEISLRGTWVTSEENSEEGVFICTLSKKAEIILNQLWEESQKSASAI